MPTKEEIWISRNPSCEGNSCFGFKTAMICMEEYNASLIKENESLKKANEYCQKRISDLQNEVFDVDFLSKQKEQEIKELKDEVEKYKKILDI